MDYVEVKYLIELIWQDIVLTSIGFMFAIFLVPMAKDALRGKLINPFTSMSTAIGLYTTSIIYTTLGLWLATIASAMSGTMWLIIFLVPYKKSVDKYETQKYGKMPELQERKFID